MNILPLVSAFILIFAIGSYTFVHNFLSSIQEREHFYGSMKLSHAYARKLQTKYYRKIKGKNLHPRKPSEGEPQEKEYESPRARKYPYSEAKLNVRPLTEAENPKLENVFINLLTDLYAISPFNSKELGPFFLKLLKQAKGATSLSDLVALTPEDKRELVYKILKGTQNFEIDESKGYPALTDFVKIGEDKEKPIHFCHASRSLLDAVFGAHIAPLIVTEEARKWQPDHKHIPLTKEELEPVLLSRDFNLSSVEELLDFVKSKGPLEEEVIEESKIHVRYKL